MRNINNSSRFHRPRRIYTNKFSDGVQSLSSSVYNRRNALNNNTVISFRPSFEELRAIYKTGIGNKIINIKADHALKDDSIMFSSATEKEYYDINLAKKVHQALGYALTYGRGVIAIVEIGKDLSQPLSDNFISTRYKLEVFGGDLVTAFDASMDLMDTYYYRPKYYTVRGANFHNSRIIDFNYVRPPQFELPAYQYGGMSEFELVRNQIISNGIVERASSSILEKNSSLFYKVHDLKDQLNTGREGDLLKYFQSAEDSRSMYGAGLIDGEDEAFVLNQSLTDLDKVDTVTLRRLAMVTNIPLTWLVGENAQGMNSSGERETEIFWWMIKNIRTHYAKAPINELLFKFGRPAIKFKEKNDLTPLEAVDYESKVIDNALKLAQMGADGDSYLISKGITKKDDLTTEFLPDDDDAATG